MTKMELLFILYIYSSLCIYYWWLHFDYFAANKYGTDNDPETYTLEPVGNIYRCVMDPPTSTHNRMNSFFQEAFSDILSQSSHLWCFSPPTQ